MLMNIIDWRDIMYAYSKNMNMVKGVGIGLAVGTVAAVAGAKMMTRSGRRTCRKGAAKCMKTVEDVMGSIASMAK